MSTVLVTGAGGYIGTTLVPLLLEAGWAVRAVDRFFFGEELLQDRPGLQKIQEDTRRLRPEHFQGVDAVIDLAAISNDPTAELFQASTIQINRDARVRCARLAREAGAGRYLLPSSASVYGFQDEPCDEEHGTNPLTTYARANLEAEQGVLPLSNEDFIVTVIRQSTVFGYSPRMRFDLAINGMTWGAFSTGRLPLLRDGTQWRPMVHVRDTAAAQVFLLGFDQPERINGQIFNVGSEACNYQLRPLAEEVAEAVPREVEISWYGDPDTRSYRCVFHKLEALGWRARHTAADAVREICEQMEHHGLEKTDRTLTLRWYQNLARWHALIERVELYGGIVDIG